MTEFVYKILRQSEWQELERSGSFSGSPDDERDGFIHLSFALQVMGTRKKHFSDVQDLVLVQIASKQLGEHLRLEVSANQKAYPHLYRVLGRKDVNACAISDEEWRGLL